MAIVLRVDDLIRDVPEGGDLSDDPAVPVWLWCMVLLMASRDHATSIHYHPWREDGGLAYIVADARHVLKPPPAELAGPFLASARTLLPNRPGAGSLICPCRFTAIGAACSTVKLDVCGDVFLWEAVVWSSGPRSGVELFRVSPVIITS